MTGRILDCTFQQYHKDPCAVPSLSASTAKRIVNESLLHAWTFHPRLGKVEGKSTEEQQKGTILHKLLLGKGAELAVLDYPDWRTKAAREDRDHAISKGKIPIRVGDFDGYQTAASHIREALASAGFHLGGKSEVPMEWIEEVNDGKVVTCRAMMDNVYVDEGVIFDVKKVDSANPEAIRRTFIRYGYDIQHEAYKRCLSAVAGCRDPEFIFLFCEIEAPYAVVPIKPSGEMMEIGRLRWEEALAKWEVALRTNQWPSYSDGLKYLDPMPWEAAEYLAGRG